MAEIKYYSEAIINISKAYEAYYNTNLAFLPIPSDAFNPIVKSYKMGEITLKDACNLIKQKAT